MDFHPAVREWFNGAFKTPTAAQAKGWDAIGRGDSTLLLAPTGSGKTLAAFLWCLNRLMFGPPPDPKARCRVVYVSPLKALAVDVERNLRAPIAGISNQAGLRGETCLVPGILVRTGDTPARERARFQREPADIVITTPESLYLMLTSNAREALRSVDTLIIDEIHALVPTKRGAHLALSVERLEALTARPLQRIGLSATQRPLDEVARYLGGTSRVTPIRRAAKASSTTTATATAKARKSAAQAAVGAAELAATEIHDEFASSAGFTVDYRPVTIVDAGTRKPLSLHIEVPVEDMSRLNEATEIVSGPASRPPARPSIWTAIYPRLLELVQQHRSTLIFVNNRRTAERLAGALNDLAGEPLVRAHHGSVARPQRVEIEDSLKAGTLRGLVATSSLELGIDMGAIDLVVQIEAPPSVASGLQRIGRAGHHVGATSNGVIFPKYRGDLIACATATRSMHDGLVESTRYPRNPLDVLAQQIVAMTAMDPWTVDDLLAAIRRAAPFAELDRTIFDGVLDMLAGRYPSDEFAELRPRLTWDRLRGTVVAREGAKRIAIANGGTIPDRGLYGVFLVGGPREGARVGELDEEMVFESRVGETFVLGASTWRIEEITHDRVLVSPAPGEPGKMPFWRADAAGRPLEFGRAIGALVRSLLHQPPAAALERLETKHDLDRQAAENLLQYLTDQRLAVGHVPDDRTIVIERVRDELGDWRVCLLSPLGGQIMAPWSMAAVAKIRETTGIEAETLWTDDGIVIRFPETDDPPDPQLLVPEADEVEALVLRQLGGSSLFAAKFREAAARALLLPRRRIGGRTPLWQQRKRAADLLAVAARFGSFPMLLEAYRECLRDLFDMPALVQTLRDVQSRQIRIVTADSVKPSPFASSLLFGYVANYLYEGDAPLAERRAQALSIDHAQLRALLGDAELRELLDGDAIDAVERELQQRDPTRHVKTADGLHDLLLRLGDLTEEEIGARATDAARASLPVLLRDRRAIPVIVAGEPRVAAVEDAARYRDALGAPLPQGLPESLLAPVRDALGDLLARYARTHAPFTVDAAAARFGLPRALVEAKLRQFAAAERIVEGEFRPDGVEREWCDPGVLGQIRRRSLARIRRQVEPVEPAALGRLLTSWQGITRKRRGLDALLDVVDSLQGAPLPASLLETEILPARMETYTPSDLDTLIAAGEIVWCGTEPLGERDGRVALFLADHLPRLWRARGAEPAETTAHATTGLARTTGATASRAKAGSAKADSVTADSVKSSSSRISPTAMRRADPRAARGSRAAQQVRQLAPRIDTTPLDEREAAIVSELRAHGASFFSVIHEAVGGGFPATSIDALWSLVWRGLITNDSWQAMRAYVTGNGDRERRRVKPVGPPGRAFRSRRLVPPSAGGRWSLIESHLPAQPPTATEWSTAMAQQLLSRYGLITREVAAAESLPGGFGAIYDVLRAMEDAGRIRRGYFVSGVGATQFALPAALELLRSFRDRPEAADAVMLAATDPGNPYGTILKWPDTAPAAAAAPPASDAPVSSPRGPTRSVGAQVILVDGQLAAYLGRSRQLFVYLPEAEPDRARVARAVAEQLAIVARVGEGREGGLLIREIDGHLSADHPLAPFLAEVGFAPSAMGFQMRRDRRDDARGRYDSSRGADARSGAGRS